MGNVKKILESLREESGDLDNSIDWKNLSHEEIKKKIKQIVSNSDNWALDFDDYKKSITPPDDFINSIFTSILPNCTVKYDLKDWGYNIHGYALTDYNLRDVASGINNVLIQVFNYDSSDFDVTVYSDTKEAHKKALDLLKSWGLHGRVRVEGMCKEGHISPRYREF